MSCWLLANPATLEKAGAGPAVCHLMHSYFKLFYHRCFCRNCSCVLSVADTFGAPCASCGLFVMDVLFLTINLCTDENEVVDYYNDLDSKLGTELNGMDVLDDLEAEHREVRNAGNWFVTYCQDLHVCRMAGCHSVLADLMDERPLGMFHAVKLVKEVLKLDVAPSSSQNPYDPVMWLEDTDAYLDLVNTHNYEVFDIRARRWKPIIDARKLRSMIWWYKLWNESLFSFSMIRSLRDWCEDSGCNRVLSWLRLPLFILMIFALLRVAIVRRMLAGVLSLVDGGEL